MVWFVAGISFGQIIGGRNIASAINNPATSIVAMIFDVLSIKLTLSKGFAIDEPQMLVVKLL